MRPVVQVPATLAADRVLALLRERRVHAAVVADATGRALGLITIQDVLTELLGSAARPAVPPGTARTKK
jgi:CBS domain containing-hemolysin-like protein